MPSRKVVVHDRSASMQKWGNWFQQMDQVKRHTIPQERARGKGAIGDMLACQADGQVVFGAAAYGENELSGGPKLSARGLSIKDARKQRAEFETAFDALAGYIELEDRRGGREAVDYFGVRKSGDLLEVWRGRQNGGGTVPTFTFTAYGENQFNVWMRNFVGELPEDVLHTNLEWVTQGRVMCRMLGALPCAIIRDGTETTDRRNTTVFWSTMHTRAGELSSFLQTWEPRKGFGAAASFWSRVGDYFDHWGSKPIEIFTFNE
ncbi:MAG: hypothetical protein KKB81_00315 [Candidatus Margulisbacteria bacterium]|nr:hypothetical protein [Candidatus Margulisiibacteriota bacterium]MBU1022399.1 hypothetical protein [Candidatus Margulisiibacteriota bacterium]MBU1729049.1 hypothetical protein [Candidatus Margulisiibacteriota bacterium]MBU1954530.1 hypothetical protein [Candidatus Margulisiibacteriota bacterium]